MNEETKLLIHRYGAFTVIVLAIFFILAIFTIISRNTWKTKLRESVVTVLTSKYGTMYEVGDYVPIKTPASVSAAIFSIVNSETGESGNAVLIRLTGISGPSVAVFTYFDGDDVGSFAGYAANTHFLSEEGGLDYNASETQLSYCAKQIPLLVSKGN